MVNREQSKWDATARIYYALLYIWVFDRPGAIFPVTQKLGMLGGSSAIYLTLPPYNKPFFALGSLTEKDYNE